MQTEIEKYAAIYKNADLNKITKVLEKRGIDFLYCICGKYKRTMNSGALWKCCGNKECHPLYGRKRPEHSKLMKKLSKSGLPGFFYKGMANEYVNTPEWKRKVLDNKKIDYSHCNTDEEFKLFFDAQQTIWMVQPLSSKIAKIRTVYEKYHTLYDLEDIDVDILEDKSKEYINKASKICNAVKTLEANKDGKGVAKRFKRVYKTGFKFNSADQREITTRSSYESNYIDFFEENEIPWEYETVKIKTDVSFYLPDFKFFYNGNHYMLEVKGYLLDESDYMNRKLRFAYKYCASNNMTFLFTFDAKPKNIKTLLKKELILT